MTPPAVLRSPRGDVPRGAVRGRGSRVTAVVGVAATSAFATGGLLTQTVVVPMWRGMEPVTFLTVFGSAGPATGATLLPVELLSVAGLALCAGRAIRHRTPGRVLWTVACAAMVLTLLLLPAYFSGANGALLDPGFPPTAVSDELALWHRWNWVRTGLALLATAASVAALVRDGGQPGRATTEPGAASLR
ncbi:hypothetical protein KC207_06770 [Phycicoccus sp. BSK3Z-2]|uniref:DUF1772 domain-containing protein n=1 Tax=Phycicoccus avicenniae TaxID=2828860 RepID=A0A941HYI1_9MICO|nr:hypothetical protein [Phycicoccus avicenniae]MBR7742988.1 hypothetical protein [Phycicoccus avicenniae]